MKKMTKKEMFAMVMEVVANSNVENKTEMEKDCTTNFARFLYFEHTR